jgi:uncharacterized protein (TIGR03083 family)
MDSATRAGTGLDFVVEFAAAAEWFADHVAHASMRSTVPSCPDWTVLDLVVHLGNVHSWAATVIETGRAAYGLDDRPSSHRARRVAEWYLGRAEDLYSVLRDIPADKPCWNFAFGAGRVGFWQRRQTHETVMHGIDLAMATGAEQRLPPHLAADGIDEALNVFLHRMHSRGYAAELSAPITLRATDVKRSWVVEPANRGDFPTQASPVESRGGARPLPPRVTAEDRPGTDAVEAPAALLLKLLWKRASPVDPGVRTSGDTERVRRFLDSRLTS